MAAVAQNGLALEHAPPDMKNDIGIVRTAFQRMGIQVTDDQMKDDRSRWRSAVAQKGIALRAAPEEMKGDRELCTAAVAQNGIALEHCSKEMKGDREVCMAAVQEHPFALK